MNKSQDGKKFAELMLAISELYSKELSMFSIDLWFQDLEEYTFEQVSKSFQSHRKDPKQGGFFPKASDVIRHIDGTPDERATASWSKVMHAITKFGAWRSVVFDDIAIHDAILTMGGWVRLCAMTNDELPYKQREFEKLYLVKVKNQIGYVPAQLAGIAEIESKAAGYSSGYNMESPAMIGDKQKCSLLLESIGENVSPVSTLKLKSIGG